MLSSHVTSLPLSLALREAGYKQEGSMFYWKQDESSEPYIVAGNSRHMTSKGTILAASPLASEMMDELPLGYLVGRYCDSNGNEYYIADSEQTIHTWSSFKGEADDMPDALAKSWLHIHSQKII